MFSILIPAYNEERNIGLCLSSIEKAGAKTNRPIEIIVSLNRCTDGTEAMARQYGATIVREDAKNLSKIRNAAARAAKGEIIVTIDADSQMSPKTLVEIENRLKSGRYIGGGSRILPERWSLGVVMSFLVILWFAMKKRILSAGLFWCYREDFLAIGGFDESLLTLEDLDFAHRLKVQGQKLGKNSEP